jgi:hypothetical protein
MTVFIAGVSVGLLVSWVGDRVRDRFVPEYRRHARLRAAARSLLDDLADHRDPSDTIRRIQAALNDRPAP